ncbi:MAG: hypothetical protein JNM13_05835 [Hyphomicrobiaceae bacterium]|nr:hypothetical protein [Hyphomicrobiaceae bacterium]
MADYYAVLKRAISALPEPTGEARRAIYEKARAALVNQLKSFDPPLPASEITKQRLALEDNIRKVEGEAARGHLAGGPPRPATPAPAPPAATVPPPAANAPPLPRDATLRRPEDIATNTQVLKDAVKQAQGLGTATHETARAAREALGMTPQAEPVRREPTMTEPAPSQAPATDQPTPPPVEPPKPAPVQTAPTPAIVAEPAFAPLEERHVNKRSAVLVAAVVLLGIVAAGIGIYSQRTALSALFAPKSAPMEASKPTAAANLAPKNTDRLLGDDGQPLPQPQGVRTVPVQTITPDGTPAPAPAPVTNPAATAAAPTTPPSAAATPATPAISTPGPLVAHRVILYEEGVIGSNQGSVANGTVVWQVTREPAANGAQQTTLKARVEITERSLVALLTIRPNSDPALPASHMVEVKFETGPNFPGKAIRNLPGVIMKPTESGRGDPLSGAAVPIGNGLFWIALSSPEADKNRNLSLLRERGWIDLPIIYETGRRAILTIEKGTAGERAVNDAITAWGG